MESRGEANRELNRTAERGTCEISRPARLRRILDPQCEPVKGGGKQSGEKFSQLAAEDFSGRRAGNAFNEVDFAGLLVVGEAVGDEAA